MQRPPLQPLGKAARGLSLVELLVALAIGSLLIVGAVFVYSQSRTTHTVTESVSRLQENGRFVMSVLEPDIQLAGYYGFSNSPTDIHYSDGTAVTDMQQGDTAVGEGPAVVQDCGTNFALDLSAPVQGVEKGFGLACAAFGSGVPADSDTLIIRRASTTPQPVDARRLQIYANRLSPADQVMFSGGTAPGPLKANLLEVRDVVVNAYYVSNDSDQRANFPSLRRKRLGLDAAGSYKTNDEEIMAGVEDLQVQFGVDMGADLDGDGKPDDADNNKVADVVNGQATRYVNAGDDASINFGQVVSVRVWVRLRGEQGEVGFKNDKTYTYGSTTFTANDNIRRLVMSRTFFLRNSRVLTN